MIDVVTALSPFAVGDMVLPADPARDGPGEVVGITETGAHLVRHADGSVWPYGAGELAVSDVEGTL